MNKKEENENTQKEQQKDKTLIVGLGASAGGLEALKNFFQSFEDDVRIAFVVVMHLAPNQKSSLTEILQNYTRLKVEKVTGRTEIQANHIYVIPPDKLLTVGDSHLELSEPEKEHGLATVNLLLRSLAEKKGQYTGGVILSGTGSDGTTGMKAIKEHGGITIAQDPDEAQHAGMPLSAIQTGVVDKILPIEKIADELEDYCNNLFDGHLPAQAEANQKQDETEEKISKILDKIRGRIGHDFTNYRRSSVLRRIDRRMRINRVNTLSEYLDYLNEQPDEVDELYKDLLINVTSFFRDPETFEALEEQVIPKLFEDKKQNEEIRIWVPGCATGEEVYSIAMLLQEYIEDNGGRVKIQIFATDVDKQALDTARAGQYSTSIEDDVTDKRLRRFFKKDDEQYTVKKEIRDMVLFADHDLLRNPPFSRLDLIACRNLLIYLNRDLQTEVFHLFHYALRPGGWLFLGKSDASVGGKELFTQVDKGRCIYRQKSSVQSDMPLPDLPLLYDSQPRPGQQQHSTIQRKQNLEKTHYHMLVRLYAPQSALITTDYEVIHTTEGIGKYLEYTGGEPSRNILDMVKPDLRQPLRSTLYQLQKEKSVPAQKRVHFSVDDHSEKLELVARKFNETDSPEELIHVIFREVSEPQPQEDGMADRSFSDDEAEVIESLQSELGYTKEQLQLSIEEYETSNEELRASNEELQSMNEEMQSTTEELQTSQEELQSVNEELETVNEELKNKVDELSYAHSDLENLMEATEMGIIFVNKDYCVQRFTSSSTEIFNLIPSDKGRPIDHLTHRLKYHNLLDDIKQVLESLGQIRKLVSTNDDRSFIMRVRPYRSTEDKIEGVVLTFTEITELQSARETIEKQTYQEALAVLGVYALERDDLETIMHRAVQQSCITMQAQGGIIATYYPEKDTFKAEVEKGCNFGEAEIANSKEWDLGYALQSEKPVVVSDYDEESRFAVSPILEECNFASSVHIAVRGTRETFGVLGFYATEKNSFSEYDVNFIQSVGNILGYSITRQRAKEALSATNAQLQEAVKRSRQYQKDIMNNSLVQRWDMGGYLHDNLGQLLASAKIILADLENRIDGKNGGEEEVAQMQEIIDEGIKGIRDLSHDIIPVDIEEDGAAHAFRFLMHRTQRMYNIVCTLEAEDETLNEISNRKVATHLYNIVQEAIKNAAVHGKAEDITVSIEKKADDLVVQVKDDGFGLTDSSEEEDGKEEGKGLRIMKHRMDLLGGTFDLGACDEGGTCITCTVPLEILRGGGGNPLMWKELE